VESKWKNYHITTFLDSLSPKTLSLEEAMDLSRDRNEMNDWITTIMIGLSFVPRYVRDLEGRYSSQSLCFVRDQGKVGQKKICPPNILRGSIAYSALSVDPFFRTAEEAVTGDPTVRIMTDRTLALLGAGKQTFSLRFYLSSRSSFPFFTDTKLLLNNTNPFYRMDVSSTSVSGELKAKIRGRTQCEHNCSKTTHVAKSHNFFLLLC
jgi:hypothetical protein